MGEKARSRPYADIHIGVVMESSRKKQGTTLVQPVGPTPLIYFLTVFGLVVLVLAGGGKFLWAKSIFVGVIGLFLIIRPPQVTLDAKLDWIAGLLMLIAGFCFIPSGWLDFLPGFLFGRPDWWKSVGEAGVELPMTASPQPLKSLEGYVMLSAVIAYFYLLINCRFRMDDRWRLIQFFVLLGGGLAWAVVVGTSTGTNYFITDRAVSFSYFDNRNQTSILMVMLGIVSLAMMFYGTYKRWWWVMISGISFLGSALAVSMSLSRAGLLLFILGCGVWIILRFSVLGGRGGLRVVVPIVAASFCLMLITGQQTLNRFSDWVGDDSSMFEDFRWLVYNDSVSMIAGQPTTGVGLGNFSVVFPHYRDKSISPEPIIHPESDWVWLTTEMGIPGLSIMAALIFFLYWICWPFGNDRLASVRTAALVAVSVFLLHTFFDVSGHQLGVVLLAVWLYRMGMPHLKTAPECKLPPWLWRGGGGVLVLVSGIWLTADTTGLMLHSSVVKTEIPERVAAAIETEQSEGLSEDIDTAMTFLPMDWGMYIQRGQARLYIENDTDGARKDFQRARAIEPILTAPAYYEGQVWLPRSTHYAYEAWADALTRENENPPDMYHRMILYARNYPRFNRELDRLSQQIPEFRVRYLDSLQKEAFLRALKDELDRDPKLAKFSEEQRVRLMNLWLERGDPGQQIRFLEANPEAAPNSWYFRAHALARMGNYPEALKVAKEFAPVPQIPVMESLVIRDAKEQRALFAAHPNDVVRGGVLLQTQINNQDTDGARWTLEQMMKMENTPPYAYFWLGELDRLDENHKEAWSSWRLYLTEIIERKIELKSAQAKVFEGIEDKGDNELLWDLVEPFKQ